MIAAVVATVQHRHPVAQQIAVLQGERGNAVAAAPGEEEKQTWSTSTFIFP